MTVPTGSLSLYVGTPTGADRSAYRQNTYGSDPDYYVDCTRSLASAGDGSIITPLNCNQAMAVPGGSLCWWLPLSECANATPVSLPRSTDIHTPAFQPANSGTSGNRTVHVTKWAAAHLIKDNGKAAILIDGNRTEMRHDGSAPSIVNGSGAGTGCAMVGGNAVNYVTYDGFFWNMEYCQIREDSGLLRASFSIGIEFRNFAIRGVPVTCASNVVMYRPHSDTDTVLSHFYAYDFVNDWTGSGTPQPSLFSDCYGSFNVLIEHFEIDNIQFGIFLKGTVPGATEDDRRFNYGTIRYGIVSNSASFIRLNDLHATEMTTIHHVLMVQSVYDATRYAGDGFVLSAETSATRNLDAHHLTVVRLDATDPNLEGALVAFTNGFGSNVSITDSIFDIDSGTYGKLVSFGSTLPSVLDYNYYTKNGSPLTFRYNGANSTGMTDWRTASGRDAHSTASDTSPFVNRAGGDYHATGAALTMSSTGGEIGAYGDLGSEVLGVAA